MMTPCTVGLNQKLKSRRKPIWKLARELILEKFDADPTRTTTIEKINKPDKSNSVDKPGAGEQIPGFHHSTRDCIVLSSSLSVEFTLQTICKYFRLCDCGNNEKTATRIPA